MNTKTKLTILAGCLALVFSSHCFAADILSQNDFIISIDRDPFGSNSSSPENETPAEAGDGLTLTKYLNFGKTDTGFIVEPFIGSTTIQSMLLTTGNDEEPRDPASWKIYGTNDPVTSIDHGTGSEENWTLIAEDDNLMLPAERETQHTPISFTNSTAYSAYRVLFPTVKDEANANSMQIAEVGLFESNDGTGASIWDEFDFPVPFQLPVPTGIFNGGEGPEQLLDGFGGTGMSQSASPAAESADKIADNSFAKYLNFGKENSGFIVTNSDGPKQLQSFQFFSANDFPERDPIAFEVYGTNETINSTEHSLGTAENWTLIDSGPIAFSEDREVLTGATSITNPNAYNSYKLLFTELRDGANANSMQMGEAFFYETATVGSPATDFLDSADTFFAVDDDETTGLDTKFLNLGGENGGFIVTPAAGSSTIDSFQLATGNDAPGRDPATWELWGTDDSIVSVETEMGDDENWVLIDSGTFDDLQVPTDRLTVGDVVTVTNSTEYRSYRMVFPTIRDNTAESTMQLSAIQFFGEVAAGILGDFDLDGDVDGTDFLFWQRGNSPNGGSPTDLADWQAAYNSGTLSASSSVPEPSSVVLVILATCGVTLGSRRRDARGSASRR